MRRIMWLFVCVSNMVCVTIAPQTRTVALFSPNVKPTKTLIELIGGARKSIHIAVYLLTDKTIADALIKAKENNKVKITVILDQLSTDRYGKADLLALNNIDVHIFCPQHTARPQANSSDRWFSDGPIMHNKFAIFDSMTLWTGSFNWTVAANTKNQENVLIVYNREICKQYEAQFVHILNNYCKKYTVPGLKREAEISLRSKIMQLISTTSDDIALAEKLHYLLTAHHA